MSLIWTLLQTAAGKTGDKPEFCCAEERRQNQFTCQACEGANSRCVGHREACI
jgi:hypothetical protein